MSEQIIFSILLIHDDPHVRLTLRELLSTHLKMHVIEASSGIEALQQISQHRIDVILLDEYVAEKNHVDIATLMKKKNNTPVLFLISEDKQHELKKHTFLHDITDYIFKPTNDIILLKRINAYLQFHHEEQRLQAQIEEKQHQLDAQNQRLHQQLNDANRHKSEFISTMSHELRTPLNAMIGYTSLTLNTLRDSIDPEQLENLSRAEHAARNLLQLINDILDFSKIEAGKVELFIEEVDVEEIIEDIVISAEGTLLRHSSIELREEIETALPLIESDYTKIKQILDNLIGNAVKFTDEGFVTVRARSINNGTAVRIEVEDTGIGIPEDKLGSIFELFKQVDGSSKKKFGGTGLGLAITKRFCEMLYIDLGVKSKFGEGTTFYLEIPTRTTADETYNLPRSNKKQRTIPPTKCSDKENDIHSILIIDDEEMNRNLHGKILENAGYTVHKAKSGQEGIRLAKQTIPDVILMDLAMPEMDGFEATQCLKQDPATAEITIIACSAFATRESQTKAFQIGCEGYITKPIEPERLVTQITKIVQSSKKKAL